MLPNDFQQDMMNCLQTQASTDGSLSNTFREMIEDCEYAAWRDEMRVQRNLLAKTVGQAQGANNERERETPRAAATAEVLSAAAGIHTEEVKQAWIARRQQRVQQKRLAMSIMLTSIWTSPTFDSLINNNRLIQTRLLLTANGSSAAACLRCTNHTLTPLMHSPILHGSWKPPRKHGTLPDPIRTLVERRPFR
jgi:hypothetical protein